MINEQVELSGEFTIQLSQAQIELAITASSLQYNEAKNILENCVMAGSGMGLILESGALVGNSGGAMAYAARQASIKHSSADGSREEIVVTQFSVFFKKDKVFECKIKQEAVAEAML